MSVKENYFSSSTALNNALADDFLWRCHESLHKKNYFNVALAGGSSAQDFFAALLPKLKNSDVKKQIRFFFSDERVTSVESSESNAGNARRLLLDPLGISSEQIFLLYDEKKTPHDNARDYELMLFRLLDCTNNAVPSFDVIYLGIGTDGHTASIFPGSDLITDQQRLVRATKQAPKPFERITMMPRLLQSARRVIISAFGDKKLHLIQQLMHGEYNPQQFPAQLILRDKNLDVELYYGKEN